MTTKVSKDEEEPGYKYSVTIKLEKLGRPHWENLKEQQTYYFKDEKVANSALFYGKENIATIQEQMEQL